LTNHILTLKTKLDEKNHIIAKYEDHFKVLIDQQVIDKEMLSKNADDTEKYIIKRNAKPLDTGKVELEIYQSKTLPKKMSVDGNEFQIFSSRYSNQFIQEDEVVNKIKCVEEHIKFDVLNEEQINIGNIQDADSFHKIMRCSYYNISCFSLPRVMTCLVDCMGSHEFCKICLKNFYQIMYANLDLRLILLDKHICPVCQQKSLVENSHDTLRNVFGEAQIQILQIDEKNKEN